MPFTKKFYTARKRKPGRLFRHPGFCIFTATQNFDDTVSRRNAAVQNVSNLACTHFVAYRILNELTKLGFSGIPIDQTTLIRAVSNKRTFISSASLFTCELTKRVCLVRTFPG